MRSLESHLDDQYYTAYQEIGRILESFGDVSLSISFYSRVIAKAPFQWKIILDRVFQLVSLL